MNIDKLIETYQARLDLIGSEIDEINEWMEDDFNPCDASGGNFDDAYYLGTEHGELFKEYEILDAVVGELMSIKEVD